MSHGLALDHAAWSSPWRHRSVRDKAVLSLGLVLTAVSVPPVPGGLAVAGVAALLLLGPIRVGVIRLARIIWMPALSILIGVATVAVSVSFDAGLRLEVTPAGLSMAGGLAVRAFAATLAMLTLACSTPMIDLLSALRRVRLPEPLIEVSALVYRLTFGLLETAGAIHAAQEARLGYVNRRTAVRSASLAASVLFVRSWERARRLEDGLAGRGYTDSLRTLEPRRLRSNRFLAAALITVTAVAGGAAMAAVLR